MGNNMIHSPTDMSDAVLVEITDPTDDSVVHTFTGPDDASVERQIDEFFGVTAADQAHGR